MNETDTELFELMGVMNYINANASIREPRHFQNVSQSHSQPSFSTTHQSHHTSTALSRREQIIPRHSEYAPHPAPVSRSPLVQQSRSVHRDDLNSMAHSPPQVNSSLAPLYHNTSACFNDDSNEPYTGGQPGASEETLYAIKSLTLENKKLKVLY